MTNYKTQYNKHVPSLNDVKFASGIKKISFWFLPKHRNVLALYTQYFHKSRENSPRHSTRVGFEPKTLAILEQCLTNLTTEIAR